MIALEASALDLASEQLVPLCCRLRSGRRASAFGPVLCRSASHDHFFGGMLCCRSVGVVGCLFPGRASVFPPFLFYIAARVGHWWMALLFQLFWYAG